MITNEDNITEITRAVGELAGQARQRAWTFALPSGAPGARYCNALLMHGATNLIKCKKKGLTPGLTPISDPYFLFFPTELVCPARSRG